MSTYNSDTATDGLGWQVSAELGANGTAVAVRARDLAPDDSQVVGLLLLAASHGGLASTSPKKKRRDIIIKKALPKKNKMMMMMMFTFWLCRQRRIACPSRSWSPASSGHRRAWAGRCSRAECGGFSCSQWTRPSRTDVLLAWSSSLYSIFCFKRLNLENQWAHRKKVLIYQESIG